MNKGPALLVKIKRCSPSFLEIKFCSLRLATILAPTGYPEISPIINGYAPIGGALKKHTIIFSNLAEIKEIKKVYDNRSLTIKNGNKLGNIAFINRSIDDNTVMLFEGAKYINPKPNNKMIEVIIMFENFFFFFYM